VQHLWSTWHAFTCEATDGFRQRGGRGRQASLFTTPCIVRVRISSSWLCASRAAPPPCLALTDGCGRHAPLLDCTCSTRAATCCLLVGNVSVSHPPVWTVPSPDRSIKHTHSAEFNRPALSSVDVGGSLPWLLQGSCFKRNGAIAHWALGIKGPANFDGHGALRLK
jgi:hypothetical protein